MTRSPSEDMAAAIEDLGWLVRIPHTIDQVIGIYAEATSNQPRAFTHGLSVTKLVESIKAQSYDGARGGKGGHSDPTPSTALAGEPDAIEDDETLATMAHAVGMLTEAAQSLAVRAGQPYRLVGAGYTGRITSVLSALHRLPPNVAELDQAPWLLRRLAEDSSWLRSKAEGIWLESKGETKQVAVQRPMRECSWCSRWRTGTSGHGDSGLCDQCRNFKGTNTCMPHEPIVRRWDNGQGATPGQIAEAKAHAKAPVKRARKGA